VPGSLYTQFTGALIKVLQEGVPGSGEVLTIRDIYQQLRKTAIEKGCPAPELRAHNDHGLALARNAAYSPPWPPSAQLADDQGQIVAPALSVLTEVLSHVEDTQERALLFAHLALGIPLSSMEGETGISQQDLADHIDAALGALRADPDVLDALSGISRTGQEERYHAMIIRLGLQDRFCAYCEKLMIQPAIGRPSRLRDTIDKMLSLPVLHPQAMPMSANRAIISRRSAW
jgi:hypothetical protein